MPSYNRIMLMGNLTRDPELRFIPSGQPVCEFGMAINRFWNTPNGERREETCFVDITVWGKQGERCAEYLKKGRAVFLEGRLQFDTWQAQDGSKRSKHRVIADRVQFIDYGRDGAQRGRAPQEESFPEPSAPAEAPAESSPNMEEVPF